LYYAFGFLMLAVAAYGLSLLVTAARIRRAPGRDVEVSHLAMGLAMAGMFVPAWAFGPDLAWELVFLALLIWFIVRSVQSIGLFGLHVPHTAIHAVMSFAMILMYWFPTGADSRVVSMSMGAGGGARMDPGLALLVAFVLFASAIFTVASPNRGATHYGSHCAGGRRPTQAPIPGRSEIGSVATITAPVTTGVGGFLGRPVFVDASHVVMSVAMGLMLLLMI
jgi:hypothetical protein